MDIVNGQEKTDNVKSSPDQDNHKVVNIYVDKETGKVIIEYDDKIDI